MNDTIERFESLDGIRTFAAVGILAMHIGAKSNSNYDISGYIFESIIPFFAYLVFLFMMISSFSMCCGYYKKISEGTISVATFYEKRYAKIWPYFAILVVMDLVMNFSFTSLMEAFADLTLVFSLLPNSNISVIGVGWTLGVIFVFYIMFPFFCFLLKNKKRAWKALGIAVIYNIVCYIYFFDENHVVLEFVNRSNIVFCFMYFMAGGVVFLYRDNIVKHLSKVQYLLCILGIGTFVGYFIQYEVLDNQIISHIYMLIMFVLWLIYAITSKGIILNNPVTKFVSGISMEIYLCHMVIFRIVEKLKLNYLFGKGWASYIVTIILVLGGAIIFSLVVRAIIGYLMQWKKKQGNRIYEKNSV